MKIRGKMSAVSLITLGGFLLSFAITLAGFFAYLDISETVIEIQKISASWNNLNASLKDVLLSTQNPEKVRNDLVNDLFEFQELLHKTTEESDLLIYDDYFNEQLEIINNLWNQTKDNYLNAIDLLNLLVEKDIASQVNQRGLLRYMSDIMNGASTSIADNGVYEISQIQQYITFSSFASEVMTTGINGISFEAQAKARVFARNAMALSVGVFLLFSILSSVLSLIWGGRIARRVKRMRDAMTHISEHNLDFEMEETNTRDEIYTLHTHIGEVFQVLTQFISAIQQTAEEISRVEDQIRDETELSSGALSEITGNIESIKGRFDTLSHDVGGVAEAIVRISGGIRHLNGIIGNQSGLIDDSVASLEEMNASINSVVQLTETRRKKTDELKTVIQKGGEEVSNTQNIIDSISSGINGILEIIEIINNISEQTNLLSMNAAIESAHAGEAGKGFAVVAEQIRILADETAENALEVDSALKNITTLIKSAQEASLSSSESFDSINQEISDFSAAMSEISSNMGELAAGSRVIMTGTESISETTHSIISESGAIKNDSEKIEHSMKEIEGITEEMMANLMEIDIKAEKISSRVRDVNALTNESHKRIEALEHLSAEYTISERASTETEPDLSGTSAEEIPEQSNHSDLETEEVVF